MKIDLHIHSTNSDGTKTTQELLNDLLNLGASIISFTDHDNVDCYKDLEDLHFGSNDLEIIPGVELCFVQDGALRDVLGYGIDYHKMSCWLEDKYSLTNRINKQRAILDRFKKICRNKGLLFDSSIDVVSGKKSEAFVVMYNELNKYEENKKKLPFITNNTRFYWDYFANKSSDFYVSETDGLPTMKEAIASIHNAGGLAFMAHPCAYRMPYEKVECFLNEGIANGINGIEVQHSSNINNDRQFLESYAKKNNLLISGGSDFHGATKPGLMLINGYNNINITYEEISPWVDKIAHFKL